MNNDVYSKVVGVTFENRQDILKELRQQNAWRSVSLIHTTFHNEQTGLDEPAIKVKDYATKKEIGWIARTDIEKYINITQMTAELGNWEGTEYCNLYIPQKPTQKQYWNVKRYCESRGRKMPLYDARAYEQVFAESRAESL